MAQQAIVMILDLYHGGHPVVIDKVDYTGQPLKELLLASLVEHYKEEDLTKKDFLDNAQARHSSGNRAYTLAGEEVTYTIVVV